MSPTRTAFFLRKRQPRPLKKDALSWAVVSRKSRRPFNDAYSATRFMTAMEIRQRSTPLFQGARSRDHATTSSRFAKWRSGLLWGREMSSGAAMVLFRVSALAGWRGQGA